MADNTEKLNHAKSINHTAINRAGDAVTALGKSLPCTVTALNPPGAVTVSFQVNAPGQTIPSVIVPVGWSEYLRIPVQVGCKGFCVAADARLGGISGLGAGVADLTTPGNLAALVFYPIGNTGWQAEDANTLVMYGEPAAKMQTKGNDCSISCNNGTVTITGVLVINGHQYLNHTHTDPQGGTTGAVIP